MIRRAIALALLVLAFAAPSASADFGFEPGTMTVESLERDGSRDYRAGSHPYAFKIHVELKREGTVSEGGSMRDLVFDLPPGLVGNPLAVPQCSREDFEGDAGANCSPATQIGIVQAVVTGIGQLTLPLFNLAPGPGQAAQLGFSGQGFIGLPAASLRSEEGLPDEAEERYGIRVATANLPIEATSVTATIWGQPADESHKPERGDDGGKTSDAAPLAFFTLPTSCEAKPLITAHADSKLTPGVFATESAPIRSEAGLPASLVGCESVPFAPDASAAFSTAAAESSSGLSFEVKLPNQGLLDFDGVAETQPVKTVVTLPEGVTANASAASGLGACSEQQLREAAVGNPGCPASSKLGTLLASSPLLEEPIEGSVYLATPQANRFGSLLALYIVAAAPERGVLIKQAGRVDVDQATGRLTATFDGLPPVPYSSFEVRLREGPRAPLVTPQVCGEFATVARLYPYSAPESPVVKTVPLRVTTGAGGGACASSEGQLPAHPGFDAGTVVPIAGSYSPFFFRIARSDGEQRFSSISTTLPTGLLGRLKGIPYCPESGILTAASRTSEGNGALELASPACPAASQVGVVNVTAGAGSSPFPVQGKAYLAGPYKGAPLSLEIITPAIAGPFDLGSVAVRTALSVDPLTAQIHAVSDPLPTILHGIPLDVRSISLQMNRPEFTLNPTNCESKSVTGAVTMLTGFNASLSNPFAVAGCKGLEFKPSLKLFFSGQTKRSGFPAVRAVLTQPAGENANVAGTTVVLPKGMLIANAHINNPCTRVQFNATPVPGEGCPATSVLGTAKAWSPLLDAPEEGKVYFRSNGGERALPDLVVALQGQVPLQLVGFIDAVGKKGSEVSRVRNRFLNVPDAPVSRFELKLAGGKKGLLENGKNLCRSKNKSTFELTGQNGKTYNTEPDIRVSCGKKK